VREIVEGQFDGRLPEWVASSGQIFIPKTTPVWSNALGVPTP
jgi:hypothetical protein